ncbi:zinc finger, CCHC-type containing protein [Tanacetum coccineum]
MTTSVGNNSVFRSFFEKQKLTGPNFIDWYRQLRLVLSTEDKEKYLEQPIPAAPVAAAPDQPISPQALATYNEWVKNQKEIAVMMLLTMDLEIQWNLAHLGANDMLKELKALYSKQAEQELLQTVRDFHTCRQEEGQSVSSYVLKMKSYIDQLERLGHPVTLQLGVNLILVGLSKEYDSFVQNYNMHSMGKTVNELHAMLKLHEETLPKKVAAPALHAIRAGKVQKNKNKKPSKAAKGVQGKGKGKKAYANAEPSYAPKPKIPPPPKKDNPAKDAICHHCGEVGHWRRNCPTYLTELLKKKQLAQGASTSGYAGNSGLFVKDERWGLSDVYRLQGIEQYLTVKNRYHFPTGAMTYSTSCMGRIVFFKAQSEVSGNQVEGSEEEAFQDYFQDSIRSLWNSSNVFWYSISLSRDDCRGIHVDPGPRLKLSKMGRLQKSPTEIRQFFVTLPAIIEVSTKGFQKIAKTMKSTNQKGEGTREPLRVRALVMTIGLDLPKQILRAQTEARKPETSRRRMLGSFVRSVGQGLTWMTKLHFVLKRLWKSWIVEVKPIEASFIPIVKVRWNSRRGPEFTWEVRINSGRNIHASSRRTATVVKFGSPFGRKESKQRKKGFTSGKLGFHYNLSSPGEILFGIDLPLGAIAITGNELSICQIMDVYELNITGSLSTSNTPQTLISLRPNLGVLHGSSKGAWDYCPSHSPYTPQYNGVSDRRNRTLLDMVRSMMSQTTIPKSFWDYALDSASRILHMVPTKKALVKCDTLTKPDKLEPRSLKCIFKGYLKETMGYSFYNPSENKVFIAYNAEFFENTSLNHEEDDQEIDEPQSDINPIRRSTRTKRAPNRMCLYIDAEEHELGDLGEPANYKAALLDPESEK